MGDGEIGLSGMGVTGDGTLQQINCGSRKKVFLEAKQGLFN